MAPTDTQLQLRALLQVPPAAVLGSHARRAAPSPNHGEPGCESVRYRHPCRECVVGRDRRQRRVVAQLSRCRPRTDDEHHGRLSHRLHHRTRQLRSMPPMREDQREEVRCEDRTGAESVSGATRMQRRDGYDRATGPHARRATVAGERRHQRTPKGHGARTRRQAEVAALVDEQGTLPLVPLSLVSVLTRALAASLSCFRGASPSSLSPVPRMSASCS